MGRVQKFFKRTPGHKIVLRIQLKIDKSEKEHLILEKVSIQYWNAKTTYIRARGEQFFFLKTHNKTSLYKYTATIGLKESSRVRTYSLLLCWFDFYNTICCIGKARKLSLNSSINPVLFLDPLRVTCKLGFDKFFQMFGVTKI